MINLINQINENDNLSNYIFYLDNARIHHAKDLSILLEKINLFYAPAYACFLNPIEEIFGRIKHSMKKIHYNN